MKNLVHYYNKKDNTLLGLKQYIYYKYNRNLVKNTTTMVRS